MERKVLLVAEEEVDRRLDIYLVEEYKDLSRSYIQKLIKEGHIRVNGGLKKANYLVRPGDRLEVNLPQEEKLHIGAENIEIDIVYEDGDILVVNKEQGMVVHPAPGNYSGTLVNGLLYYCGSKLSSINGELRPGIVHRIDKDTSGLLVVAKNNTSHRLLAQQFKNYTSLRKYHAIVCGNMRDRSGSIKAPIGRNPQNRLKRAVIPSGKPALSHFKLIKSYRGYSHLELRLETGRTHQIRVHLAHIGRPILGDPLYGYKKSKFKLEGQVLHAKTLGFVHPTTNKYIEFTTDLPQYFNKLLDILENNYYLDK